MSKLNPLKICISVSLPSVIELACEELRTQMTWLTPQGSAGSPNKLCCKRNQKGWGNGKEVITKHLIERGRVDCPVFLLVWTHICFAGWKQVNVSQSLLPTCFPSCPSLVYLLPLPKLLLFPALPSLFHFHFWCVSGMPAEHEASTQNGSGNTVRCQFPVLPGLGPPLLAGSDVPQSLQLEVVSWDGLQTLWLYPLNLLVNSCLLYRETLPINHISLSLYDF